MAIQNYLPDGVVLAAVAAVVGAAVPSSTKRVITAAALVNSTAAAATASVYLVPDGAAVGPTNVLISARVLAPGETYFCPELINQGLNAGGTVQALGVGLSFKFAAKDIIG